MKTKVEALAQGLYYPEYIRLAIEIADHVPPSVVARAYAHCLRVAGLGEIVRFTVPDIKTPDAAGSYDTLEHEIGRLGPEQAHAFRMITNDQTELGFSRGIGGSPTWSVLGEYPPGNIPTVAWMEAMTKLCIAAADTPGFQSAALGREETSWAAFPPMPPIARYNHLITVTDAEVADSYDDPASFWNVWDRVERVGDRRVCIRALDKLDVESWLGWTFESTMHLARIAKPKRTVYRNPGDVRKAFAPWWEFGDEERAGYPVLSFVGYDPTTRTVEYAGFCTDIAEGDAESRHVLIQEIHAIRALVKTKRTRDGHLVETVRVVFPEEWMARRERRPLLDVGARVYFTGPSGTDVEVTG